MEEWINCPLGEILNFRRGHDLPHTEMAGGDIPVAGSNGIIGFHNEASPISPCITIGRSGNVGIPFMYNRAWAHNTTLYIDDFKGNDPLYIFYLLKTLPLSSFGGGSAVPTLNRNHIHPLIVKHCTNVSVQRRIASVLKSFDDKIELNNRINHNLEEQAQALYKSWFVDFEPFKGGKFIQSRVGLIPETWAIQRICDLPLYISDYVSNGSFASLKENVTLYETPNYAQFIRNTDLKCRQFSVWVDQKSYEYLAKSKLEGGEIIISNVGDVGSVHICPQLNTPMTLGNNVIMIKPLDNIYKYFIYMTFKWFHGKDLIKGITGGSAMPKFNKTDFKSLNLLIPDYSTLCKFNSLVSNLFEITISLNSSNQRLSEIRDSLLPKLMSGELKINDLTC